MTIDIRPLDTSSPTELRAYWEVGRDAVADRPYNTHLAWQAASAYYRHPRHDMVDLRFGAWDDDRIIAFGGIGAPALENTDTCWLSVGVLPELRRRGIGSQVLALLEDEARRLGRQVALTEAFAPTDADSPGSLFATRHGFRLELEDGIKVVDLVETRDRWAAMADEVAPHHAAYRLVTHWAPIPDELIDGYCRLNTAFNALIPTGDAPVELERWDEQRVRSREEHVARAGRLDLHTFALDAAGEAVGLTELLINTTMPERAMQSGTLVLPDHRGHRLGLAVKLANHRALVERFPEVEWMVTGNADVNAAMNAVNERLGYRTVERCLEMRKEI